MTGDSRTPSLGRPGTERSGPIICVFCGATSGNSPIYLSAARDLALSLHKANATLVYGGGTVGIMGELARTLVSLSGPEAVHGIIPKALMKREKTFQIKNGEKGKENWGNTEKIGDSGVEVVDDMFEKEYGKTTIVPDMHSRKKMMAQRVLSGPTGSGFVALPGGYGTLEELMEMVTWNQLGIHKCGIVVLNVNGYWDGLLDWVRKSVAEGFVGETNKDIIVEVKEIEQVVQKLKAYEVAPGRFKLDWGEE